MMTKLYADRLAEYDIGVFEISPGIIETDMTRAVKEKYDRLIASEYCRPGCGDCLDACPYDVPINDVLRYAMYAANYGREHEAMRHYARIDAARHPDNCLDCPAPCEAQCPFALPIRLKLLRADQRLRWC
jgi:predicted aldo/keto reductase-like oxidoreductase